MTYSKWISPVGWYLGSYLLRFVELEASDIDDPEARFQTWENTVLVKADSLSEAYDKTVKIGRAHTARYRGGDQGVRVRWMLVGVTDILPIYEPIEDGAEILWQERHPRKLGNLRKMVRKKGDFVSRT